MLIHANDISTKEDNNANTSMHTTSTDSNKLKPLGDLSYFPREIRDEIYRHVLPKKYMTFESSCVIRSVSYEDNKWIRPKLSIFRLSKAINDETMSIFYSEGTFEFRYGRDYEHDDTLSQIWNVDFMNRIMNIEISTSDNLGQPYAGPVQLFQGDVITRKSFLITLIYYPWEWSIKITESPLFRSLKQLTGFKTVTLRFVAVGKGDDVNWEELVWEPLLTAACKDLESTLGNGSARRKIVPTEADNALDRKQQEVVFHPRDHKAKVSK